MYMKKLYIKPTSVVSPFVMESYLHNLSANTVNGASSNGGSSADGEGSGFGTGEGSVGSGDFSKKRGFYSGYDDEY